MYKYQHPHPHTYTCHIHDNINHLRHQLATQLLETEIERRCLGRWIVGYIYIYIYLYIYIQM